MSSVDHQLGRFGRIALTIALLAGVAMAMPDPVSVLNFTAYGSVGAFVAVRRPRNPIGWILVVIAFSFIATSSMPDDIEAVIAGTASTADFVAAWVGTWAGGLTFLAYATLAMIFPSGRLPAGLWWRRATRGSLLLGAIVVALGTVVPKIPFSPDGGVTNFMIVNRFALIPPIDVDLPVPGEVFIVIPIGVFAVGVLSAVTRYRRSTGVERLQLRWLMASLAFAFASLVFGLVGFATVRDQLGLMIWLPALIAYPTVPLAVGVAVMRYRLYEINRIVSRTIAYGLVSAILAAVFGGVIVFSSAALSSFAQGDAIAVAASTLATFAAFQPVLRRVRREVDRRFDRTGYDAERTVARFSGRMRDQIDLAQLSNDLDATIRDAVAPQSFGIWLREGRR